MGDGSTVCDSEIAEVGGGGGGHDSGPVAAGTTGSGGANHQSRLGQRKRGLNQNIS